MRTAVNVSVDEYQRQANAAMSEAQLQSNIIDAAQKLGWRVAHFRPAMTAKGWRTPVEADAAGFPDLVMVRGGRQIVAELKRQGKKPTLQQILWLRAFEAAGAEAYFWRPSDWSSGAITDVLSGGQAG